MQLTEAESIRAITANMDNYFLQHFLAQAKRCAFVVDPHPTKFSYMIFLLIDISQLRLNLLYIVKK